MLSWELFSGGTQAWDELVLTFPDHTVYQSRYWGEHRTAFGWEPCRMVCRADGDVAAAAQVLLKRYPFRTGVLWIPGGPLGAVEAWGASFQLAFRRLLGLRIGYCRMNPMRPYLSEEEYALKSAGWSRSQAPMLSGRSLMYVPERGETERLGESSKNWRHNLRRAARKGVNAYRWAEPDADAVMALYVAMQGHKQLDGQTSLAELDSLFRVFGDRCLVVRCDDEAGNMLSVRGALLQDRRAWDVIAATNPAGRSRYASYSAFWELMRLCGEQRIEEYDMGGADQENAKGVYDFKKGTGAVDLRYLGEWDYAFPSSLAPLLRKAVALKLRS